MSLLGLLMVKIKLSLLYRACTSGERGAVETCCCAVNFKYITVDCCWEISTFLFADSAKLALMTSAMLLMFHLHQMPDSLFIQSEQVSASLNFLREKEE